LTSVSESDISQAAADQEGLMLLHPFCFRRRFGEEMLEIFDEVSGHQATLRSAWNGEGSSRTRCVEEACVKVTAGN
jgi:hypothetical protein